MRTGEDAAHYLSIEKLPQLDEALGISEFFRQLSATSAGGAVVWKEATARYVDGRVVARALTARAGLSSFAEATRGTLGDYLKRVMTYPVEAESFTPDSDVSVMKRGDGAPSVLRRVIDGGAVKGFVFAHDTVRNTAVAPPPIWLCEDGDKNTDPEDGCCSRCPRSIKGWVP